MLLSISLWERAVCELFIGKFVRKVTTAHKFLLTILGLSLITISYVGFAITESILILTIFFSIFGLGWGIASPIKNSLFATNLDKSNETFEVGLYESVTLIGMAVAVAFGGIVAYSYGYRVLFLIAAVLNTMSILPYIFLFLTLKKEQPDYNYTITKTD